jgi:hypothetical protein
MLVKTGNLLGCQRASRKMFTGCPSPYLIECPITSGRLQVLSCCPNSQTFARVAAARRPRFTVKRFACQREIPKRFTVKRFERLGGIRLVLRN